MELRLVLVVMVAAAVVRLSNSMPTKTSRAQALDQAFSDRATVEAIIDCFVNEAKCNAEQNKIRVRAMATMRNFGQCPPSHCTPEEKKEMERAMLLLQKNHRDLWLRLIASMFGISLKR